MYSKDFSDLFLFQIHVHGKIEKVFNRFVKVAYFLRKSKTLYALEYPLNNKIIHLTVKVD